MSSVLHAKRELERSLRSRVTFTLRGPETDAPVEVHGPEWEPDWTPFTGVSPGPSTWLGSGETHIEAIEQAHETIRVRRGASIEKRLRPRRRMS